MENKKIDIQHLYVIGNGFDRYHGANSRIKIDVDIVTT
jgi:hypothetical protein